MSNPEKRDERSMSDILASIRKIMAQEPALAMPPSPSRQSVNGVSGATLDLPREPEFKLPGEKGPSEGGSPTAPPAAGEEPVSLDELLAETPLTTPPSPRPPAVKPAPASASPTSRPASPEPPEWLFPKPNAPEANDKPAPAVPPVAPPQAREVAAKAPGRPAADPHLGSVISKAESREDPKMEKGPAASPPVIGPPAPRLGDLGSVVPGKLEGAGPVPTVAAGPPATGVNPGRTVPSPPLAGPLLGEATRAPAGSEPLNEVPGADALRRLIADVVPPSARPSFPPAAKGPDAAAARTGEAPKPESEQKQPAPEIIKGEAKVSAIAPPPEAKKPEASGSAPAAGPAAAPVSKPEPAAPVPPEPAAAAPPLAHTPAAPVPAQKAEAPAEPPAAKPAAAPVAPKSMEDTVVELLRPLLREWLNTNMPRLIEPALKAEIDALRNVVAKETKD